MILFQSQVEIEQKLREKLEKQLKMDGTVKMRWNHIKRDTTVWNLTKPYEIEQNIQWHETVIDQMDIRNNLNNEKKKIKTAQNCPKSEDKPSELR